MSDLITPDLVRLDADLGTDKHDVIRALAKWSRRCRARDLARPARRRRLAREGAFTHRLPGGIAIPHRRTTGVESRPSPSPG